MDPISTTSTTGAGSSGNSALEGAFAAAIAAAEKTLIISTNGQAELNALRARPN